MPTCSNMTAAPQPVRTCLPIRPFSSRRNKIHLTAAIRGHHHLVAQPVHVFVAHTQHTCGAAPDHARVACTAGVLPTGPPTI